MYKTTINNRIYVRTYEQLVFLVNKSGLIGHKIEKI
jgi:hypothetical protein